MSPRSRRSIVTVIAIFAALPFLGGCMSSPAERAHTNLLESELDVSVHRVMEEYRSWVRIPGFAIGVLLDGERFVYGYGETAIGTGIVPDEHTIFEIGSLSKTFTATLWADEALRTGFDLDTPVAEVQDIHGAVLEGATVKQLLNHTSGLPRLPADFENGMDPQRPYRHYTEDRMMRALSQTSPSTPPGSTSEYSNLAYGLAGVLLERRSSMSYEELIRSRIANPLGMDDTGVLPNDDQERRFAQGHTVSGDPTPRWSDSFASVAAAGALFSTVDDMLSYGVAQLGNAPAALNDALSLTHEISYGSLEEETATGLGWFYTYVSEDGATAYLHDGGTGGFSALMAFSHSDELAVVLLGNGGDYERNTALFFALYDTIRKTNTTEGLVDSD